MLAVDARPRPGSLLELEKVLALEDGLPHERVPVDDYFNDYVHGLTTMAHQQAAAHPCSDGPRPSDSCGPPSSTAVPLGSGLAPSSTAAPTPLLHPQQAAAWPMGLAPASGVPALQQLGHMAVVPMPLAAGVPVGLVAAGKQPAAAHCNGKAANGRSGASAQRQATNREAQKRYRERQKARLLEMQVTIDRLTRELQQRQGVQQQNAALEEKHFQLQAQLVHVETEAEVLAWQRQQAERERRQLRREAPTASHGGAPERPGAMDVEAAPAAAAEAQPAAAGQRQERPQASLDSSEAGSAVGASQSHNNSVGDLAEGAEDCPAAPAAAAKSVGFSGSTHLPDAVAAAAMAEVLVPAERAGPAGAPGMYGAAPPHEAFDELLLRFQAQVAKVKAFLDARHLRMHNPSSVVLEAGVRGELLQVVMESLGICRGLLRVEGVDVIAALQQRDEATMGQAGAAPGSATRQKWLHVIQVLHLTPEQRQALLLQRGAHLALMRRIGQQRQQLNMQAMSLMLLAQAGPAGGDASCGAQTAKLATVLRLIKENLRREQRAAMEINSCTLSRILTPVQAALYICEAFPLHCDALGMCNVLSTLGTGERAHSGAGSAHTPGNSGCTPGSSTG